MRSGQTHSYWRQNSSQVSLKLSWFVPLFSATILKQHEFSGPDLPEKHKALWLCLGILPTWKDSSKLALSLEPAQTQHCL